MKHYRVRIILLVRIIIKLIVFRFFFQDDPNELHVEYDHGVWEVNDEIKHVGK